MTVAPPEEREEPGEQVRFVAVSNRLPIVLEWSGGKAVTRPGVGGLITALAPVLRDRGGVWIGWPGVGGELEDVEGPLAAASRTVGYQLVPVPLSLQEVELYYQRFANGCLWPLFHDLPTRAVYDPEAWQAYQEVNRRFAAVAMECTRPKDFLWVHDYHLLLMGRELRALGTAQRVGFFLHIPFPHLDIFLQLPWWAQVLNAMLEYDLIGFQTHRDRRNFVQCVKRLIPGARTRGSGTVFTLAIGEREVRVGTFPIGIDYQEFAHEAAAWPVAEAARYLRDGLGDRTLILGVDRLDYTKGIPARLEAFRTALRRYPEMRGNVTLIQVVVPSRTEVPEYRLLRSEIDRLVGEINGEFTEMDWAPIHYMYRSLSRDQLLAYYRAADIALVTPLKDGMNLVAKEYCASDVDEHGVLILSDFAGAAAQLHRWCLTVNPNDVDGVAEALMRAYGMPLGERRYRMRRLRLSVRRNDIYRWVDAFLLAGVAKHLDDFQPEEDYFPPFQAADA
jgi:trehalose 6-phosphate synthase/phosphatase